VYSSIRHSALWGEEGPARGERKAWSISLTGERFREKIVASSARHAKRFGKLEKKNQVGGRGEILTVLKRSFTGIVKKGKWFAVEVRNSTYLRKRDWGGREGTYR